MLGVGIGVGVVTVGPAVVGAIVATKQPQYYILSIENIFSPIYLACPKSQRTKAKYFNYLHCFRISAEGKETKVSVTSVSEWHKVLKKKKSRLLSVFFLNFICPYISFE